MKRCRNERFHDHACPVCVCSDHTHLPLIVKKGHKCLSKAALDEVMVNAFMVYVSYVIVSRGIEPMALAFLAPRSTTRWLHIHIID